MDSPPPVAFEPYFTVKEFAFMFDRSEKTIWRLIKAKRIKVRPLGRPYQIPISEYRRVSDRGVIT